VEKALEPLTADGSLLVSAREVPPEPDVGATGVPYVLTVHGGDRPGIVSAVTRELAAAGGNITDLTTRLTGSLYLLVAEVDLPADVDVDALTARLAATGESLGVGVTLREQETDVL
jgi:glycine cleavage system transcriptional repressor